MSGLRFNRPYPNTIKSVNLSACDIPRLRDLSYMFYGCWDLVAVDLSPLDVSEVTTMKFMFGECLSLKSLDLSGLDTSKV